MTVAPTMLRGRRVRCGRSGSRSDAHAPDCNVDPAPVDECRSGHVAVENVLPHGTDLDEEGDERREDAKDEQADEQLEEAHRGRNRALGVVEDDEDEEDVERGEEDRGPKRNGGDEAAGAGQSALAFLPRAHHTYRLMAIALPSSSARSVMMMPISAIT